MLKKSLHDSSDMPKRRLAVVAVEAAVEPEVAATASEATAVVAVAVAARAELAYCTEY